MAARLPKPIIVGSGVFTNLETGGGHIDGHKNLMTFFGKLTSVDLFLENDQLGDPFLPPTSVPGGGPTALPPVFKPFKKISHHPKGAWHNGPPKIRH
jgi:hypothetical protein